MHKLDNSTWMTNALNNALKLGKFQIKTSVLELEVRHFQVKDQDLDKI